MSLFISAPFADPLRTEWYHNTTQAWLTAAITAAVLFVILVAVRGLLVSRVGALAKRTSTHFDDMAADLLAKTRTYVLFLFAVLTAARGLTLPIFISKTGVPRIPAVTDLLLLWQAALWASCLVAFWVRHHLARRTAAGDETSVTMINAIGVGAKVLMWLLILLVALQTVFGINVTTLITTLGVGGIAVALAVQNILGDVLAALAIVFDKPFDVGDLVNLDTITGTVEHIGLKTTHIRSLGGDQIIVGNGDMLKSKLHNLSRMSHRRVVFTLDVAADTPPDALAGLPAVIEEIVRAQKPVAFDRCTVTSFTDAAVRLETAYNVLDADYKTYMSVQQAIVVEIRRRLAGRVKGLAVVV